MAKKHAQNVRAESPSRRSRPQTDDRPDEVAAAASRRTKWTFAVVLLVGVATIAAASIARQNPQGSHPTAVPAAAIANTPASPAAPPAEQETPAARTEASFVAQRTETQKTNAPLPPGNPLNGDRAYKYLKDICAIGRRLSGSPGMKQQQELLKKHFESLGGKVVMQEFEAPNPLGGKVPMANMIVTWHPDRKERLLLSAHYDTRPYPDHEPDPAKRKGTFIGANDGASGVAVMMELSHLLPRIQSKYGVDFVLFDGEELVYDERRDKFFLGSEHFAREYVRQPPEHKYKWGVLIDMVGDADLQIFQERNSISWRDTRPLVNQIWSLAQRLGVHEFVAQPGYEVSDDHIALHNVAKIPTCDIIDFDYPVGPGGGNWHTEADVPENCSGASLAKVGWVLYEWFKVAD